MNTIFRKADAEGIALGARLLRQGEILALPTETVYGIAADARQGSAVAKIFAAKGRPQDNPLIVHIAGMEMLQGLVSEVSERAQLLAAAVKAAAVALDFAHVFSCHVDRLLEGVGPALRGVRWPDGGR